MDEPQHNSTKSVFVDVVAWISIVMNSMILLAAIGLGSFFYMVFSSFDQGPSLTDVPDSEPVFSIPEFIFGYTDLIVVFILLIAAIPLVSSIGLLLRKNWARLLFIVILGLNMLAGIFSLIAQFFVYGYVPLFPGNTTGADFQLDLMLNTITLFSTVFSLLITGFYGWIIWKLATPPIIDEFRTPY